MGKKQKAPSGGTVFFDLTFKNRSIKIDMQGSILKNKKK
jgi:hypothetical protein